MKIEVEPMAEARWSNVERKVMSELEADAVRGEKRPSRKIWFALAVVPVAAAAAIAFYVRTPHEVEGARIVTTTSPSRVVFHDSVVDVGPSSAATLAHGHDGVVVTLDYGRIECEVAPRSARDAFVVVAGDIRVRVVGTHFVVVREPDAAEVEVQRGVVEVTAVGAVATLHAGDRWSTPPTTTTQAAPSASTVATIVVPEAQPELHVRATSSTDVPLSPQREFELAATLEQSDPNRATAIYEGLSHRGGSWAENALFAEGRLEIDRGNAVHGRRLLQAYLVRYPQGANAADARSLLERVPF